MVTQHDNPKKKLFYTALDTGVYMYVIYITSISSIIYITFYLLTKFLQKPLSLYIGLHAFWYRTYL